MLLTLPGHIYVMMPCMRRTTIFLSEPLHERLREEAFRSRVSLAQLIRSRIEGQAAKRKARKPKQDPLLAVAGICSGPVLSRRIDEELYGL